MSVPEVMLWVRLRARPGGFKFRRQHPAGPYVLDFFCSKAGLAVEVDGMNHDMGDRPVSDAARDAWLGEQNIKVLHIPAGDIARDAEAVIETIIAACYAGSPLHHPSDGPPPRSGEETV
jgi:very-short-patch-repair endonuclease